MRDIRRMEIKSFRASWSLPLSAASSRFALMILALSVWIVSNAA